MKHPTSESWMDFLFGEIPAAQRADLERHLQTCDACREQLKQWENTRATLDQWTLPEGLAPRRRLRLGWVASIAAMALLFAGVSLGWWLGRPALGSTAWQSAVRAEVERQLPRLVSAAMDLKWPELARDLQAGMDAQDRGLAALKQDHQQTRQTLAEFQSQYQDGLTSVQEALLQLETKRVRDAFNLRQALETVAMDAEGRLQLTEAGLLHLATHSTQAATP